MRKWVKICWILVLTMSMSGWAAFIPMTFAADERDEIAKMGEEESLSENIESRPGSSMYLVIKAWEALEKDDLEAVLDFTDECVNRYAGRALQMQENLTGYVEGTQGEIRSHWALNDVATALFIQGKALQKAGKIHEAKSAYFELINKYSYGQCWDPKGWFWKPAEVAKEYLEMIKNDVFYDFGNYSSEFLVVQAWKALEKEDIDAVLAYTGKCIALYSDQARAMQSGLSDYPQGSRDEIFKYWALNDVATSHFIRGRAFMISGDKDMAVREFSILRDELKYGQCWDPKGWFWKPYDEAETWLNVLNNPKDN